MTTALPAMQITDSILDEHAHTFAGGRWGICLNGQTYQQEAIVTCHGYQYATYFGKEGYLCAARRALPEGEWEVIVFEDYKVENHEDVHNVSVIGICPEDGTVHLSFDHHCHPMHYRKSVSGVAANPPGAWRRESFGPVTSVLKSEPIPDVTYPLFFPAPNGTLQLVFRSGYSGNGDWHLWEYAPAVGWNEVCTFLGSKGIYGESADRCAYPNQFRYDAAQRLHVTWCWREEPALDSNHDLCYAYSEDFGRTWLNNAGERIADENAAITVNSPGIVVTPIPLGWGQMNQTTQYVDGKGRVHVIGWQNPLDAKSPNHDLNQWRFIHFWRDEEGVWSHAALPFQGRKPNVAVSRDGTIYVIFCEGRQLDYHDAVAEGILTVAAAPEAFGWKDWRIVWRSNLEFVGEPRFDLQRWEREEVLSIYAQEAPAKAGGCSPLHVISLNC